MMYVGTVVKMVDNTEGFYGLCMGVLSNLVRASVGDVIVVSMKSVILNKHLKFKKKVKVLKGSIYKALVISVSHILNSSGLFYFKTSCNCVAMLGSWDNPLGTRIVGPSAYEISYGKFSKFSMLSEGSF